MTPEQIARSYLRTLSPDESLGKATRDLAAAVRAAINDKLDEVAAELDKLEQGHYTSAQTPAGLVRAMKVK